MGATAVGRPVLRCRQYEEPVSRVAGAADAIRESLVKVTHTGSGEEKCTDGGHVAAPTDIDPELKHIAARTREKYPEYDTGVVFGVLVRATLKDVQTPVPVEAATEEALLAGIARQVRMRELDAQRAGRAQ